MISIIITAYKEQKTIGRAIQAILDNNLNNFEILVVAPDAETLNEAKKFKKVKIIKEKEKSGKPAAMNLAISKAKGNILAFTDGDVYIDKNAMDNLLKPLENKKIGAVTGRPVSLNSKTTKFGYWSYMLTEIAHIRRMRAVKQGKRFFCSGYLFAIRKELFPKLPEELLSEDGYISHIVYEKDYKIAYSPQSKVFVSYPANFSDWIKQKKRSAGGYNQNYKLLGVKIRSFGSEAFGFSDFFKHTTSAKELFWLIELFVARTYLWALIYMDINIRKKTREEIWIPIESTK